MIGFLMLALGLVAGFLFGIWAATEDESEDGFNRYMEDEP